MHLRPSSDASSSSGVGVGVSAINKVTVLKAFITQLNIYIYVYIYIYIYIYIYVCIYLQYTAGLIGHTLLLLLQANHRSLK